MSEEVTTRDMQAQDISADEPRTEGPKLSTADLLQRPSQDRGAEMASATSEDHGEPLVSEGEAGGLRDRWTSIQANFVDEPQSAVEEADTLVAEVIQSLARRFADERQKLEQQWHSGSEVSTEDLRQALQHYRSFFQRLLAA